MCESTVLVRTKDGEREIMTEVIHLRAEDSKVTMMDLKGNTKTVSGRIESIDFLSHRVFIRSFFRSEA